MNTRSYGSVAAVRSAALIACPLLLLAAPGVAQSERAPSFEWKRCEEDVLGLRVDPGPVQDAVGSGHRVALEDGRAMVAIMIQDCPEYWIDGRDLGPNRMVHVLARLQSPEDVRPVVGAPRTEPTMSWFGLFTGSTNPRDREARMASGTAPQPIRDVSLGASGFPRAGQAILGPDARFSWRVPSAEPISRLSGFNHDIYVRDGAGGVVLKRVQAIGRTLAAPSQGTLEVEGEAGLGGVIGAGRYPTLVYTFSPIWARAALGETTANR